MCTGTLHGVRMTSFTAHYHRDEALRHADDADQAMELMQGSQQHDDKALHQRIGVNLKLADLHARLALVAVQVTTPPTPPSYKTPQPVVGEPV